MDFVNEQLKGLKTSLEQLQNNKLSRSILIVSLILYSSMAAPKVPKMFLKLFDNNLFKLVYIFAMFYLSSKNLYLSLICAVALLITFQTLLSYESVDNVNSQLIAQVPVVKLNDVVKPTVEDVVNNLIEPLLDVDNTPSRESIVNACIKKAEAYYEAANKAKQNGDNVTAELHLEQAEKNEAKALVLNKAEEAKHAVERAIKEGQSSEVIKLVTNNATNEEEKAKLVVHVENVLAVSKKAAYEGDLEKANQLNDHVSKMEKKIVGLSKNEVGLPVGNSSCGGVADKSELGGLDSGSYANF